MSRERQERGFNFHFLSVPHLRLILLCVLSGKDFPAFSRKLQKNFKTKSRPFSYQLRVLRWMQKLLGLAPGADSKTGARVEQTEILRTTVKSVEITVETAEMIQVERVSKAFSELDGRGPSADHEGMRPRLSH
jgi:hypothetical protein